MMAMATVAPRCPPRRGRRPRRDGPIGPRSLVSAGLRTYAAAIVVAGEATVTDAKDTLTAYRNRHRYGSCAGTGDYEFTIKAHAFPPDWVEAAIGDTQAYEHIGDEASDQLRWAVEALQERHPWIGDGWCTAGRSGGWLLLTDLEDPAKRYDNALYDLEAAQRDGDIDAVREAAEGYRAAAAAVLARSRELPEIERDLRVGAEGFERLVTLRSFWQSVVPRKPLRRRRRGSPTPPWRR